MPLNPAIDYRADIDGLRAIAVLVVVLFHAGYAPFAGGFVGVDVFFVISGFLITSILLRELSTGTYSIAGFYARRARRILPALLVVVSATSVFAWVWLLPQELQAYARSVWAVAGFAANVYFWRSSDYFSPVAEEQPLLHTWSLAVEEQYYIVFPLLLAWSWRRGRTVVLAMMLATTLVSMALMEWGWRNSPSATFFLLPTRAWELLFGSVAAYLLFRRPALPAQLSPLQADAVCLLALVTIFAAVFGFDKHTPFPSLWAVLPVGGAVALMLYGARAERVGAILAWRPVAFVGLLSYSIYLWHQPVLVAYRRLVPQTSVLTEGVMLALVGVLSYLTYRFVETPARRSRWSRPKVLLSAAAALAGVVMVGSMVQATAFSTMRPVLARIGADPALSKLADWVQRKGTQPQCRGRQMHGPVVECLLGDDSKAATVALWGDSLAHALMPGFDQVLRERGIAGRGYITVGCPPIPGLRRPSIDDCDASTHERVLALMTDRLAAGGTAFLHGNLVGGSRDPGLLIEGQPASWANARSALVATRQRLEQRGVRLWLVEQGPTFPEEVAAFHLRERLRGSARELSISRASHLARIADVRALGTQWPGYLATSGFFCPGDRCPASLEGVGLVVYDNVHYTPMAALALARYLLDGLASAPAASRPTTP